MGTRHLICIVKDDEYKVAQYGQWDGYPEGQGTDILKFLTTYNKEKFLSNLDKRVRFGTEEELDKFWEQSDLLPELSRSTGAKILGIIQKTKRDLILHNSIDFASDSLFCEYAYVIDFDKNTFEVYEGFNHVFLDPTERFTFLTKKSESEHILDKLTDVKEEYFPVKLWKMFDLDSLPNKKDFLKEFKREDDK